MNKFIASILMILFFSGLEMIAQTERGAKNTKIEQKIALIIGNTNYDNSIGKLTNPVNDANDMAESLKRLGFTLVGGKPQMDVNRKQMLTLIRDFGSQIKQGGIGFFYFSGHGVQVNKENYLIPITDALVYEDDAETEAVKVDMVAKEMESAGNRLNILVLDACRNNGLQKRTRNTDKGLTEPTRKPEGTFIAFSAGDGQTASDGTGKNGLFTQELLKNLEKPNFRLDDIFRTTRNQVKKLSDGKQIPVIYDSTSESFLFKTDENTGNQKSNNPTPSVKTPKQTDPTVIEREFWEAIKNSTDAEDFRLYLKKYPNGIYIDLADLKIKRLPQGSSTKTKGTPGVKSDKPPQTNSFVVNEDFFTFEIISCSKSGTSVVCQMTITNNSSVDKLLGIDWASNGRIFDESGNQNEMEGWQIAGKAWGERARLLSEVPTKASFRFKLVSAAVKILKRFDLRLTSNFTEGGNYVTKDIQISFKNIPLN